MYVPVVDQNQQPLMPTIPSRARRWIKSGKATPFWKKGVFCVRLNVDPSNRQTQPIAVGIDPGSQREGLTVKSEGHTYLNIQAEAVTWVKDHVETRRNMRRFRRYRKTPCRANRKNRARGDLPPSTKARWQWKLRLCRWLAKMFPISCVVVEDIKAWTKKGQRRWNGSFSPLEVGKQWFYAELEQMAPVETKQGYETKELRDASGLKKTKNKRAEVFEAHCVDSWVLANWYTGGHVMPDNTALLFVKPLRFHRRQLHVLQPSAGGMRKPYGGTRSLGFTRGSLVKHAKYGLAYVGGCSASGISLHRLTGGKDGGRLCRNAKPSDLKFLTYASWVTRSQERRSEPSSVAFRRQSPARNFYGEEERRLMRVYVAGRWADRESVAKVALTFEGRGFEVVSRWIKRPGETLPYHAYSEADYRQSAEADWLDLIRCDVFVLLNDPEPSPGGRHVETGLALAWKKRVMVVGPPSQNVFHYLPGVERFANIDEAIAALEEGQRWS